MKQLIGLIAALLLMGAAGQVYATAPAQAASADCTGPAFTWQRLGGDPFARTEAEAMRKHPEALARAVAMGCMPQHIADAFAELVREHPGGMATVTIVPGARLAFMESGAHPILNVTVGRNVVSAGTGLVVSIEARAWRVQDEATGIIYQWMMPFVCFNWSLTVTVPDVPAVQEEPCVVTNYAVSADTDRSLHLAGIRVDPNDRCTGWRYSGETAWRGFEACSGRWDCFRDERLLAVAREKVGNADLTFTAEIPVIATGVIQVRTSRRSLEQNAQVALWACLELLNGRISDGILTRYDDYHYYEQWDQHIASVFRTQASVPGDWAGRRLVMRFGGSF